MSSISWCQCWVRKVHRDKNLILHFDNRWGTFFMLLSIFDPWRSSSVGLCLEWRCRVTSALTLRSAFNPDLSCSAGQTVRLKTSRAALDALCSVCLSEDFCPVQAKEEEPTLSCTAGFYWFSLWSCVSFSWWTPVGVCVCKVRSDLFQTSKRHLTSNIMLLLWDTTHNTNPEKKETASEWWEEQFAAILKQSTLSLHCWLRSSSTWLFIFWCCSVWSRSELCPPAGCVALTVFTDLDVEFCCFPINLFL